MEGRPRRLAAATAMVVTAALSAGLLVYVGILWKTVHNVAQVHTIAVNHLRKPAERAREDKTHDPVFTGANLLLIGNDERHGMTRAEQNRLKVGPDGGLNTDTMMIVHIPADGSRATLISLPRDSYVHIPGYGMNKLNAAYANGYLHASGGVDQRRSAGIDLLVRTIHALTGVPIDHYLMVSLLGFVRISDAIGGVPINLCRAVDDTVAHNVATGLGHVGSGFVMSRGHHTISGVRALEFVRQRENLPQSDISRGARQRYFLTSAFRSLMSASVLLDLGRLNRIIGAVRASVIADPDLKILDLVKQLSDLSANDISGHVIHTVRYWHTSPVGDVGIVDPHEIRRYIAHLLAPHARRPTHRVPNRHKTRHAVDAGCID